MKKYISGQIGGLSQEAYEENFARAEALLMNLDHQVVNPVKVSSCLDEDCNRSDLRKADGTYLHAYSCYMKYDVLAMLEECDTIVMLPNHSVSPGADFEKAVAIKCGLAVWYIHSDYTEVFEL